MTSETLQNHAQSPQQNGPKAAEDEITVKKKNEDEVALKKEFGFTTAVSFTMGSIIGSGIFVMPKSAARGGGSIGMTLIMWLVTGFLSLMGSLSFAELGTMIPLTAGKYQYLKKGMGRCIAFIYMVNLFLWTSGPDMAVLCLTFARYLSAVLFQDGCGEGPSLIQRLIAATALFVVVWLHCYSVKVTARLHVIASSCKVLALVLIVIGGIYNLAKGNYENFLPSKLFENTTTNAAQLSLGMYGCMWAYSGWDSLPNVAEELKNPQKNIPRTAWLATTLVTLLYMFVNVSYFSVMSVDQLLASPAVGVTWAEAIIPNSSWVISLCVVISTFGTMNTTVMKISRAHFVLARDEMWPSIFSMINVKRYTPIPAVLITFLSGIIAIAVGDIEGIVSFVFFTNWLFYGLVMVCLFIMRRTWKDSHRPFKASLVFPFIFGLFAFAMVVIPITNNPKLEFLYAFLLVMGNAVFYVLFVKFRIKLGFLSKLTCFFQMLFQVCPTTNTEWKTISKPNKDAKQID